MFCPGMKTEGPIGLRRAGNPITFLAAPLYEVRHPLALPPSYTPAYLPPSSLLSGPSAVQEAVSLNWCCSPLAGGRERERGCVE